MIIVFKSGGLSKFARIAKSVTRNRSILMNFAANSNKSIHIDQTKPSQLSNVSENFCQNLFFVEEKKFNIFLDKATNTVNVRTKREPLICRME